MSHSVNYWELSNNSESPNADIAKAIELRGFNPDGETYKDNMSRWSSSGSPISVNGGRKFGLWPTYKRVNKLVGKSKYLPVGDTHVINVYYSIKLTIGVGNYIVEIKRGNVCFCFSLRTFHFRLLLSQCCSIW